MSKIIAINAGSSSLKFQLFEMPSETVLTKGLVERIGLEDSIFTITVDGEKQKEITNIPDHAVAVNMLLKKLTENGIVKSLDEIGGIGHRVVHGGEKFADSVLITDEVLADIEELSDLAPLHNPANVVGIKAFQEVLPNVPAVAVFDTAFHQTMPESAFLYSLPYEYYEKFGIRKYGFHGTSHKYVSLRVAEKMGKKPEELKVITCHLGNGSSVTAVEYGKVIDTSMGLTPLDGFMMGTRSGGIDPSVVTFIMDKENLSPKEMDTVLNKKSGVMAISGISSDDRDICAAQNEGDERATLAHEMQAYQIAKFVGAYIAAMNGVDAIVFTGGIGENGFWLRSKICSYLGYMGRERR